MLQTFVNIFKVKDLRNKILFTLGLLAAYRIGYYVPLPGVDQVQLTAYFKNLRGTGAGGVGQLAEYFAMFTGGNLQQSTIFGLGIMPYISASIILQLLARCFRPWRSCAKRVKSGGRRYRNTHAT